MSQKSKTALGVEYYLANKDAGVTVYAAAQHVDIDPAAIYRSLKKLTAAANKLCPCCGQPVPTTK